MEENKDNIIQENNGKIDKHYWRPVMIFYAKSTAWVIFPLILALLVNKYFTESLNSQTVFFVTLMIGFGITCFGIYREIKRYKKDLDKK